MMKYVPTAVAVATIIGGFFALDFREDALYDDFSLSVVIEMAVWPILICAAGAYLYVTHASLLKPDRETPRVQAKQTHGHVPTSLVVIPPYDPDADPDAKP